MELVAESYNINDLFEQNVIVEAAAIAQMPNEHFEKYVAVQKLRIDELEKENNSLYATNDVLHHYINRMASCINSIIAGEHAAPLNEFGNDISNLLIIQ